MYVYAVEEVGGGGVEKILHFFVRIWNGVFLSYRASGRWERTAVYE